MAALLVVAAPAAAKGPCWKAVVNDWLDNARVDDVYDVSCYQEAIKHLPTDAKYYSSAAADITRALQNLLLDQRANKNHETKGGGVAPATTSGGDTGGDTVATPTSPGGDKGGGSTPAAPSGGNKSGGAPPAQPSGGDKGGGTPATTQSGGNKGGGTPATTQGGAQTPTTVSAAPLAPPATTRGNANTGTGASRPPHQTDASGRTSTGPLVEAINAVGPKKADSFPVPLIVLAAIAMLLLATGAAGFVVRRRQGRPLRALPTGSSEPTARERKSLEP